jgi:acyl-CoA reductase-like NAD-dependent aldehyde dehydrogenase
MVQNRKSGEIVAGGERMTEKSALDDFDFSRGSFYPPTVITGVDTNDDIWQEEIFGPVVIAKKFRVSSLSYCLGMVDMMSRFRKRRKV